MSDLIRELYRRVQGDLLVVKVNVIETKSGYGWPAVYNLGVLWNTMLVSASCLMGKASLTSSLSSAAAIDAPFPPVLGGLKRELARLPASMRHSFGKLRALP